MKNSPRSFYIKSLGCKTNQIEGQVIAQDLVTKGFLREKTQASADIFILNSCSVTSHSDKQALYLIKQARKLNLNVKIVLTGCMAQTVKNPAEIDADLILGNSEKLEILKYINELFDDEKKSFVSDIFDAKEFSHRTLETASTTRPSIKIQEGCNNRCSYCLIPFARGNSRSNSIENIINQINTLAAKGHKEIVLTGIHIGQWGFENDLSLIDLLKEIENTEILRYRLGSLYVNEIDEKLLEFLKTSKKFCPHFHLSLQSLCDKTLENMNRKYTVEFAIKTVEKIKNAFKSPFLGCDIITGFPMENEEDFEMTHWNLEKMGVSYIHSFPYSVREGTKAATMDGQIQEHVKKERTKRLMRLSEELQQNFLEENKNTVHEILFQSKSAKNGLYSGITRNYIKVYEKSEINLKNTIQVKNLSAYGELY